MVVRLSALRTGRFYPLGNTAGESTPGLQYDGKDYVYEKSQLRRLESNQRPFYL